LANASLGAALLADFEDPSALKTAREIADKFFVDQNNNIDEMAAANALVVWIDLRTKLDQINDSVQKMKNLISKQSSTTTTNKQENEKQQQIDPDEEMLRALPIVAPQNQHLAISLLVVHLLSDQNQFQHAHELFSDYLKSNLSLDFANIEETALYAHPNLNAIQILLASKREPNTKLTHSPWINETHPIVRKRLFALINNNNNNNNN